MFMINLLGVGLIGLIVWWFWLYKPEEAEASDSPLVVVVENGLYQPARLKLPAGQAVTLQFLRKDASPCAASVLFPDFEITEELPAGQEKLVRLPAMEAGEYPFHCQMNMYRGVLVVM